MAGIFLTQINRICNLYILLDNALTIGIKTIFSITQLPSIYKDTSIGDKKYRAASIIVPVIQPLCAHAL